MPCFRGIELSVVASSDHGVLPEFPHPESLASSPSSATVSNSRTRIGALEGMPVKGSLSDRDQNASSRISVYVPSAPDSNFHLHYSIHQPPMGHKYLFFKMIINGRHIVSWGVNTSKTASGATQQALFEPSADYEYTDNGMVVKEAGIESRSFRFVSNGASVASVADDGGLIEVRIFRAKARSRRAPRPDAYRGRDKYGIALVCNGLLESPQEASYYDYRLLDAKDSPYVSFCFHYRSWENLKLLHLAPSLKPGFLCPASLKATSSDTGLRRCLSSSSPIDYGHLEMQSQPEKAGFGSCANFPCDMPSSGLGASCSSTLDCDLETPLSQLPETQMPSGMELSIQCQVKTNNINPLQINVPELHPAAFPLSTSHVPPPSKAVRDEAVARLLERPLPDIPVSQVQATVLNDAEDEADDRQTGAEECQCGRAEHSPSKGKEVSLDLPIGRKGEAANGIVSLACTEEEDNATEFLFDSCIDTKSGSKALLLFPFTDSLRKRGLSSI